jgi:hypothetical protein
MEDNSIEKQHVIIDHSLKKLFKTGWQHMTTRFWWNLRSLNLTWNLRALLGFI